MTLSGEDLGDVLEMHLMSDGLYVTDCTRHDDALHIGYESPGISDTIPQNQVGTLLRFLLDLAGIETDGRDLAGIPEIGEWEPEDVEVWAFEEGDNKDDRETIGHFEVHEGWFHALDRGNLSETDFSTLVLSTLE